MDSLSANATENQSFEIPLSEFTEWNDLSKAMKKSTITRLKLIQLTSPFHNGFYWEMLKNKDIVRYTYLPIGILDFQQNPIIHFKRDAITETGMFSGDVSYSAIPLFSRKNPCYTKVYDVWAKTDLRQSVYVPHALCFLTSADKSGRIHHIWDYNKQGVQAAFQYLLKQHLSNPDGEDRLFLNKVIKGKYIVKNFITLPETHSNLTAQVSPQVSPLVWEWIQACDDTIQPLHELSKEHLSDEQLYRSLQELYHVQEYLQSLINTYIDDIRNFVQDYPESNEYWRLYPLTFYDNASPLNLFLNQKTPCIDKDYAFILDFADIPERKIYAAYIYLNMLYVKSPQTNYHSLVWYPTGK